LSHNRTGDRYGARLQLGGVWDSGPIAATVTTAGEVTLAGLSLTAELTFRVDERDPVVIATVTGGGVSVDRARSTDRYRPGDVVLLLLTGPATSGGMTPPGSWSACWPSPASRPRRWSSGPRPGCWRPPRCLRRAPEHDAAPVAGAFSPPPFGTNQMCPNGRLLSLTAPPVRAGRIGLALVQGLARHGAVGPAVGRAQDHFHPDDAGYAAIAADFTAAILGRR
jgi:hypothetical protein